MYFRSLRFVEWAFLSGLIFLISQSSNAQSRISVNIDGRTYQCSSGGSTPPSEPPTRRITCSCKQQRDSMKTEYWALIRTLYIGNSQGDSRMIDRFIFATGNMDQYNKAWNACQSAAQTNASCLPN